MFCPVHFGKVFSQQGEVILGFGLSRIFFSQKVFILLKTESKFLLTFSKLKKSLRAFVFVFSPRCPKKLTVWKSLVKMKGLLVEPSFVMTSPSCIWGTGLPARKYWLSPRAWFLLAS